MLLALLYVAPVFASQGWSSITQGTVGQTDEKTLGVGVYDPTAGSLLPYQVGTTTNDNGTPADTSDDTRVAVNRQTFDDSTFLGARSGGASADADAKYTKVGNTVWAAAGPNTKTGTPWGDGTSATQGELPYSLVYVRAVDGAVTTTAAGDVAVSVRNVTTGQVVTAEVNQLADADSTDTSEITVSGGKLNLVSGNSGFHGYFFITSSPGGLVGGHPYIVAGNNDVIQVTGPGGVVREVKVDASGPRISGTTPLHDVIQTGTSAAFSGTIMDGESGIAPDVVGEDATGTPESNGDGDGDGVTAEPRALAGGASRDVQINMAEGEADKTDFSAQASTGWTALSGNAGFRFTFTRAGLIAATNGYVKWNVVAKDRVNNRSTTDADGGAGSNDDFVINIDGSNPKMGRAEAGIGYDPVMKKDKNDPSSIKVTFTPDGIEPNAANTNGDRLDQGTVDAADFRIDASRTSSANLAIARVTHPNHAADEMTGAIETRNVVYITLENPLEPDARPNVNVIGALRDRSGRLSPSHAEEAEEKIAPTLSVVVSGPPDARPVVKGTATDKAIVRISSNEALTRTPSVYLVNFQLNVAGTGVEVKSATLQSGVSAVSGAANTWEVQLTNTESDLAAVWVMGTDRAVPGNRGMTGGVTLGDDGMPSAGDAVDLTKLTLFEFDNSLPAPEFTLTPSTTTGGRSTESSSPFVRIDFAEDSEYNLTNGTDTSDSVEFGTPPVRVEVDSHNGVTLTKLTITDSAGVSTDLLGQEGSVDVNSFIVALSDLEKGTYTLHVNGTDAAGNARAQDAAYALSVVERAAFKVSLSPGWNLVSVPGDPSDPSLDAVLPSSHPATMVLSYAPADPDGPWLTATRSAGMDWSDNASNTLTEIGAGHGYWINTNAFVGISTLIDERSAASVPPTYEVLEGWNLLGVTDVTLQQSGTEVSVETYLASSPWSIAYTFDTQSNTWTKHAKGGEDTKVKIGQGMWVYMTADGALAP